MKDIASIRILPNSKDMFPSLEDFKVFIEKTMVDRGGYYYFPESMMNCPDRTLVLFQYDGKIQAYGILIEKCKKTVHDEQGILYAGYYKFDIQNLHFLKNALCQDEIKTIYPDFSGFHQSKQTIPLECLDDILKLL